MKTLDELKAENAEEEESEVETPQVETEETELEAVEEEAEEAEMVAEPDQEEAEETEIEDWQRTDEDDAEKKYTDSDMAAVRKKWKGRASDRNEELEQLRQENERLKQGGPVTAAKPKRSDFFEAEDPDEAYLDALSEWRFSQGESKQAARLAAEANQRKQREIHNQVQSGVDQHYVRAVELSTKSGISPEVYQSSDMRVRQAVDAVFPERGDLYTDKLISDLGEGSEKVFYSLGVNGAKLSEFTRLLSEDATGVKAAMYLGTLKAELNATTKRKTNAPKPAKQAGGEDGGTAQLKTLKKAYQSAEKSGDAQAMFDARRNAKQAGADVSNW